LAVAPFDEQKAKSHQRAWAEYLGTPVEVTNSIGMKLVLIPPGEFLMGSPESERDRGSDEQQHRVRITKPFFLGVHEVTQAEYQRVMGTNPSVFSRGGSMRDKLGDTDTSQFPVEDVTWDDAVSFCSKLSQLPAEQTARRVYRLPSEAEWECACRSGTTTPFHFGGQLNGTQANCNGQVPYGTQTSGPRLERTAAVGSYSPNAFGLYDMHGNVWEWCHDWYEAKYYTNSPTDDPQGPTQYSFRVIRGGGWNRGAGNCRSAFRYGYQPANRSVSLGFRAALVPPSK
jgi:formylglycine-generating enzyme required for sulfatase activity